ncbi:hypothetical protein BDW68DRAFT_190460 [Aspergillus falconensis]
MRIRTYGVERDNRRVKEYLALPEHGIEVQWWLCETREIPNDWEAALSLREVVNIKYSRLFRFQHPELSTTYSFEDWKAGRTAQVVVRRENERDIDWGRFREKGLQIIVKLGGTELTPEHNPRFLGGDWHADGLLNEHIAGVAVYCFDLENIADPCIAFTQKTTIYADEFCFDDNREVPYTEELFGIKDDGTPLQDLGSVPLRQGRLATSPNCLQQRLEPFEMVDKTRSGHCHFLMLWLVDPYYRSLLRELGDQNIDETGLWLMNLSEAQRHRVERAKEEALARRLDIKGLDEDSVCLVKAYSR